MASVAVAAIKLTGQSSGSNTRAISPMVMVSAGRPRRRPPCGPRTPEMSPVCTRIPASRTFKRPELHRELAQQRPRYVSAALTIIRAYIVAGRPVTPSKAFAGFGDWSDMSGSHCCGLVFLTLQQPYLRPCQTIPIAICLVAYSKDGADSFKRPTLWSET